MLLITLANLAGRKRVGQEMFLWAHKLSISPNCNFPSPLLRGNFLTFIQLFHSQKFELLSSHPLMLDLFTGYYPQTQGNGCECFRVEDGSTAWAWGPATEISPLKQYLTSKTLSPPQPTCHIYFISRKLTTCETISELISETRLRLHTGHWHSQFCYVHFLVLSSHLYCGFPRGRPPW